MFWSGLARVVWAFGHWLLVDVLVDGVAGICGPFVEMAGGG